MNRIKELRIQFGLTQSELAQQIGLNQTAIGKYERGELEPSIETLKKLSFIFECSIDYIIGHSDDFGAVPITQINSTLTLTKDEQELINDYRSLAPSLQEMLRATIQTWKGAKANTETKNRRA